MSAICNSWKYIRQTSYLTTAMATYVGIDGRPSFQVFPERQIKLCVNSFLFSYFSVVQDSSISPIHWHFKKSGGGKCPLPEWRPWWSTQRPKQLIFKIATFVRNSLHGRGPTYLSPSCIPISEIGARAHLRSAAREHLTTPRTRTRRFGPRSFRVSGPTVWNSLPDDITNPELTLEHFKTGLKTYLFRQAYA